jgi:hypothetical protein
MGVEVMKLIDVTNGIIVQLKEATGCNVYDDEVVQGLEEGSFFVQVVDSDFTRLVGKNRAYNVTHTLIYFPETQDKALEYGEMQQLVFEAFDYLKVGDALFHVHRIERLGSGRDDALIISFDITINFKVVDDSEKFTMDEMEVYVDGKG